MSNNLIFTVKLVFEDKIIEDQEIDKVAKNILEGLKSMANNQGLAPEESETFTKEIHVTPVFGETTFIEEIN